MWSLYYANDRKKTHVEGTKDGLDSPLLTDIERKALWHHVPKTYKCS